MKNKRLLLLIVLIFSLFLFACGNGNDENGVKNGVENGAENGVENDDNDHADLPVMTMEEVEENDGRDGSNAYVVVDGIVYDVTESDLWPDGEHQGQHQAGQDLTTEIMEDSPHGLRTLDNVPAIGRIEDD